ncbi:MAG TPA: hypothetical protein VEJ36_03350 [Nitrososphaerales archaeon]|nr:hypothetical protein [Nitrososphaerales archaeon]
MEKVKLYYAHAMCTYGTDIEKTEIEQISKRFPTYDIIDPGAHEGNPEKSRAQMQYCFGLIDLCDAFVFSRLLGKVTAGVGLEIVHALSKGIIVYDFAGGGFKPVKKPVAYLSRDETIRHYEFWSRVTGRM